MSYSREFRLHWRGLAAAAIGLGSGYLLVNYVGNLFTPHLLDEFGWQRSDLALLGVTSLLGVIGQPLAGRMADRFGVRPVALVGVLSGPLLYLALSAMNGSLWLYFTLCTVQVTVVGGTTATVVYSKLIAQRFDRARGVALGLAACSAPAVAAIAVPSLATYIDQHGWRAGYVLLAVASTGAGLLAIALIPSRLATGGVVPGQVSSEAGSYAMITRNRAFPLLLGGVLLCNLSWTFQTSQLKVLLLDKGMGESFGSMAVSLFAGGVITGRLLCGVLLDRLPTPLVSALFMSLPGIGLCLLATPLQIPWLMAVAVLLIGLSLGGEGDVLAYAVMRYFPVQVYSSALGLVMSMLALSISLGALLFSVMLKSTGSFVPYLYTVGGCALLGGYLFLSLRRVPRLH